MAILDNLKTIKKYDCFRMGETIDDFYLQAKQTWSEIKKLKLPRTYRQVNKIVVSGMGASGLAGQIIKELYKEKLKAPLEVINSYDVPGYLDRQTIFIASSYSGSTEETIASTKQARQKGAKIIGITTGSRLAAFLRKNKYPVHIINPKYNSCRQPRLGLPYSLVAHLAILQKLGFLELAEEEMKRVINLLSLIRGKWGQSVKQKNNLAKQISSQCHNKMPIIIASQFLVGNAHVLTNQINENGKNFATYFVMPELNHHLLEALANPEAIKRLFRFFFIESDFYRPRILARYKATQKVLKKQGLLWTRYKAVGKNRLAQVFEVLTLGSYVSFYLAILNKINPTLIPWVDFLKKELARYGRR